MTSSSSPRFTGFIRDVRASQKNIQPILLQPSTVHSPSNITEQQPYTTSTSTRSRNNSSTSNSIDPFHYQALQDTNEALKSEVHRLASADKDNTTKLKLQLEKYTELDEAYKQLQDKYTHLADVEDHFNQLQNIHKDEKSSYEYCVRENEQLKSQNEHLLNELARLTQVENRDRTRSIEQADLRRQYDDISIQCNELKQNYNELKEKYRENQLSYENDIKHLNDETLKFRLENEQLHSANDLLRDERNQMKESHETVLKRRLDEIKYLQSENRDLQMIRQKYNEERETFQAIDLRKTQLENDLLTMHAVEDRCQDLQTTVERLESEVQLSIKELESASMLNTQMRAEISNATNINERLTQECDRYRTNSLTKSDEYDVKRRENEQLIQKVHELESTLKSLYDTSDLQKQLNVENEVNKLELKRKQDDFEQFQKMHDVTKQENQETIHLLEEKIHDLERKTELQSLKHEEILLEFESLKARRDRILPSSNGTILSNSHSNAYPLTHHWPTPTMVDSQTSPTEDAIPPILSPPIQQRPLLKSTASQSTAVNENHETKQKPFTSNQAAQIVVAKYSYEPLQCSPNDHPEVELPLTIGEYYLIYGDVDEDGFYDGRNLEGRYGLIPSNFIEAITNSNDLPETVRHIIQRLIGKVFSEEPMTPRRDQPLSIDCGVFLSNRSATTPTTYRKQLASTQNGNPSDILTTNGLSFGKHVPCPTNLRVEKYLTTSILIAWNPPSITMTQILGYQILLDHSLYTTICANERTRALIENININEKFHRISIRTITQHGLSRDQECTLLLTMSATNGNLNDLSYAPSDLRVDRINQTSAVVSWWPASNDIVHKLFVNDIEVQTLKAGVYRFKLSGLLPNTIHKVTIKAKPNNTANTQQLSAASIEFCTTAFDESIEPPKRVQAIGGPQSNTLLVSWEQTLSTTTATRGYRVLVDGRQIHDIINSLNDHTVININALRQGRFLTVRALTENDGESHDSIPVDIDEILKKLDMDIPSMPIPVLPEENFDRESMPLTASSSLTLRTTSDDEVTNSGPLPLPTPHAIVETQQKSLLRSQEISSSSTASPPSIKQNPIIIPQSSSSTVPPSPIKSTTNPDKIRPITKNSARPAGITPIQSPLRYASTISSASNDVPQIEINSPSPNSPVIATAAVKSKTDNHDQLEQSSQCFGYDAYMKQPDDSTSHVKPSNTQRKPSKTSPTMPPLQQRPHPDSKRDSTIITIPDSLAHDSPPINKSKIKSLRHTSTSSEEQYVVPPTPMKTVKLKQQQNPPPIAPVFTSHLNNKTNNPPRLFIALFDYDPNAMSPNKDNEEELPFKEGQLIRIYGDQDADGFFIGQTENGRTGYVPSNMVSEIQLDDAEIEAHLLAGTINLENHDRVITTTPAASAISPSTKRISAVSTPANIKPISQPVKKMVAMFDYNPSVNSPNINPDEELSFRSGDIIYVHGNVQEDGFYFGELEHGGKGLVPSNFLKEVSLLNSDENIIQQNNEQMITNENKKSPYYRKAREYELVIIVIRDAYILWARLVVFIPNGLKW
ncbi:unnamed protein product [Rotaria magnacalcarata]|uniref:RIMS-binding protein 2 n=2 Tax=Rotaria magnacalcarata TaxID=392030 RepID=A0A819FCX3_9BILA|nr:unnamed protein product [Rotaria magnacalcarata]